MLRLFCCCCVLICSSIQLLHADEWDSFINATTNTLTTTESNGVELDGFIDTKWKVFWQEDKKAYHISLTLSQDDLPSQVKVTTVQQQVLVELKPKAQYIRVPDDGQMSFMTYKIEGDKVKIKIPKKKLKSII